MTARTQKILRPGESDSNSNKEPDGMLARAGDVDSQRVTRPAQPPYTRSGHVTRIDHDERLLAATRASDIARRGECERIAQSYRDASIKDVLDTAGIMGRLARLRFRAD